jgi:hypothetical protein
VAYAGSVRQDLLWPRRIGLAGAVLTLIGVVACMLFNPFDVVVSKAGAIDPEAARKGAALVLLALMALVGVLPREKPLFASLALSVAWVGSLVLGSSWYLVFLPPPFMLIGLGSVLYMFALVLTMLVALK